MAVSFPNFAPAPAGNPPPSAGGAPSPRPAEGDAGTAGQTAGLPGRFVRDRFGNARPWLPCGRGNGEGRLSANARGSEQRCSRPCRRARVCRLRSEGVRRQFILVILDPAALWGRGPGEGRGQETPGLVPLRIPVARDPGGPGSRDPGGSGARHTPGARTGPPGSRPFRRDGKPGIGRPKIGPRHRGERRDGRRQGARARGGANPGCGRGAGRGDSRAQRRGKICRADGARV
jgi:hypothetical protein